MAASQGHVYKIVRMSPFKKPEAWPSSGPSTVSSRLSPLVRAQAHESKDILTVRCTPFGF